MMNDFLRRFPGKIISAVVGFQFLFLSVPPQSYASQSAGSALRTISAWQRSRAEIDDELQKATQDLDGGSAEDWKKMRANARQGFSRPTQLFLSVFSPGQKNAFIEYFSNLNLGGNVLFEPDMVVTDLRGKARVKGNGLGILSVTRQYAQELVKNLDLEEGYYDLESILRQRKDHVVTVTAGGQSTRNIKLTQSGKLAGLVPMESKQGDQAAHIIEPVLDIAINIEHNYADEFMWEIIYGDALLTFDPDELSRTLKDHPEMREGVTCLLLKMDYKRAPDYGFAQIDDKGGLRRFQEKYKVTEKAEAKKRFPGLELNDLQLMQSWLEHEGYLSQGQIFMNPAFTIAGVKGFLAYARLAGIIDEQGRMEVRDGRVKFAAGNYLDRALEGELGAEIEIDNFGHIVKGLALDEKETGLAGEISAWRGQLYGLPVEGVWYDTGSLQDELDILEQKPEYTSIIDTYGLKKKIASRLEVAGEEVDAIALNSYVRAEKGNISSTAVIGASYVNADDLVLEEGSQVNNVYIDGISRLHVYRDYLLDEGTVQIDGKDFALFKLLHQRMDDPKAKSGFFSGIPLAEWQKSLGVKFNTVEKIFDARIFPAVSVQLLEQGVPIDDLDARIWAQLPDILEFLQRKSESVPDAYKEALKNKRCASISDTFSNPAAGAFSLRRARSIELVKANLDGGTTVSKRRLQEIISTAMDDGASFKDRQRAIRKLAALNAKTAQQTLHNLSSHKDDAVRRTVVNAMNNISRDGGFTGKVAVLGGTGNIGVGFVRRLAMAGIEVFLGSRNAASALKRFSEQGDEITPNFETVEVKTNQEAVSAADVVILAVNWTNFTDENIDKFLERENQRRAEKGLAPLSRSDFQGQDLERKVNPAISTLYDMAEHFQDNAILVSPAVPLAFKGGPHAEPVGGYDGKGNLEKFGSAAEQVATVIGNIASGKNIRVVSALHNIEWKILQDHTCDLCCDVMIMSDDESARQEVMEMVGAMGSLNPVDMGPLSNSFAAEALTPTDISVKQLLIALSHLLDRPDFELKRVLEWIMAEKRQPSRDEVEVFLRDNIDRDILQKAVEALILKGDKTETEERFVKVASGFLDSYNPAPVRFGEVTTVKVTPQELETEIVFGTSGYRAFTDETGFTMNNVGRIARATAEVMKEESAGRKDIRIGVGYDGRENSDQYAMRIAEVLTAYGIKTYLSDSYIDTPAGIKASEEYDLFLMVTASHNDDRYNGEKIFQDGVVAPDSLTGKIAKRANEIIEYDRIPFDQTGVEQVDITTKINARYEKVFPGLAKKIRRYLSATGISVTLDLCHGSAAPFAGFFRDIGAEIVRDEPMSKKTYPKELFYEDGEAKPFRPEPLELFLDKQAFNDFKNKAVKGSIYAGIDGDGDRLAAWIKAGDGTVRELTPNELGMLFGWYLVPSARTTEKTIVAKTLPTTKGIDALAQWAGLELKVTPVGSKHFAPFLKELLLAVEESGHLIFAMDLTTEDGTVFSETFFDDAMAEAILLLEILAYEGRGLEGNLALAKADLGFKGEYRRISRELTDKIKQGITGPLETDPRDLSERIISASGKEASKVMVTTSEGKVVSLDELISKGLELKVNEGMYIEFTDGSWVQIRLSGTEPVMRIYAEASSEEEREALTRLVGRAVGLVDGGTGDNKEYALENSAEVVHLKANLGANAVLGVSAAAVRLAAAAKGMPEYEYIARYLGNHANRNDFTPEDFLKAIRSIVPISNVMNGGKHGSWSTDIQEWMLAAGFGREMPFWRRMEMINHTVAALTGIIKDPAELTRVLGRKITKGFSTSVGDEGGYTPLLEGNEEALKLLTAAIKQAGYEGMVSISTDAASSEFFDEKSGKYILKSEKRKLSSDEWAGQIAEWTEKYDIVSEEDTYAENDWEGWKNGFRMIGDKVMIIGDDLTVTNLELLKKAIEVNNEAINSILIKINQNGSISGTLEVIQYALQHGISVVISHRSGETEDIIISHLVIASALFEKNPHSKTGQMPMVLIKTGGFRRSDRMAKYNEILSIERELERIVRGEEPRFARPEMAFSADRIIKGKSPSTIIDIDAMEIYDSRGNPTVRTVIKLNNGLSRDNRVPSGASTGTRESIELRDGMVADLNPHWITQDLVDRIMPGLTVDEAIDLLKSRVGGKGVQIAVDNVNFRIAPLIKEADVDVAGINSLEDLKKFDQIMFALEIELAKTGQSRSAMEDAGKIPVEILRSRLAAIRDKSTWAQKTSFDMEPDTQYQCADAEYLIVVFNPDTESEENQLYIIKEKGRYYIVSSDGRDIKRLGTSGRFGRGYPYFPPSDKAETGELVVSNLSDKFIYFKSKPTDQRVLCVVPKIVEVRAWKPEVNAFIPLKGKDGGREAFIALTRSITADSPGAREAAIQLRDNPFYQMIKPLENFDDIVPEGIYVAGTSPLGPVLFGIDIPEWGNNDLRKFDLRRVDRIFNNIEEAERFDEQAYQRCSRWFTPFAGSLAKVDYQAGGLVLEAKEILDAPGAVYALKELKKYNPFLRIIVYAADQNEANMLKMIGIDEYTAERIEQEKSLNAILEELTDPAQGNIPWQRIAVIASQESGATREYLYELAGLHRGMTVIIMPSLDISMVNGEKDMALMIGRAVAGIYSDYSEVGEYFREGTEIAFLNKEISEETKEILDQLGLEYLEAPFIEAGDNYNRACYLYRTAIDVISDEI